jgi:hypothetical protein
LVSFAGESHPIAGNAELISFAEESLLIAESLGLTELTQQEQAPTAAAQAAVFDGDDLIGGFNAIDILNAPWGNEAELLANIATREDEFPPLVSKAPNIMDAPVVTSSAGNAWATQINLFPSGPSATAPSIATAATPLETTTADQADPEPNPFDPDSPNFRSEKYHLPLLGKYKCPYSGCG